MQRFAFALAMFAGCGRIGFDGRDAITGGDSDSGGDPGDGDATDAAVPLVDLPCNTPVVVGPLPSITPDMAGAGWIATTATPTGLTVVFSSNGGKAVTIDLRSSPPVLGPPIAVGAAVTGNLQAITLGSRILASAGGPTTPTTLMLRDANLGEIVTRDEPGLRAGGPDHSAPHSSGGALLVGFTSSDLQVVSIDAAGATSDTRMHNVGAIESASIGALPTGDHAVVWHAGTTTSIGFLAGDLSLAGTRTVPITDCRYPRVAATGGGRIGISCICTNSCTFAISYDRTGDSFSSPVMISNAALAPTRMAATSQSVWIVHLPMATTAQARRMTPAGAADAQVPMGTVPMISSAFGFDVAARADGRTYAVWIDTVTNPMLRVMQLCP